MIKTDIINDIVYSFDNLKSILSDKLVENVYYLLLDETYFEKLEKHISINREIITLLKRIIEPMDILKYAVFKTEKGTTEIYDLMQEINKHSKNAITILDVEKQECTILFIANSKEFVIENYIFNFLNKEAN